MNYNVMITERAEEHLDQLMYHLLRRNEHSYTAPHFLASLEAVLANLKEKPYKYPVCRDRHFEYKNYREAELSDTDYKVIFKVKDDENVYLLGIFRK